MDIILPKNLEEMDRIEIEKLFFINQNGRSDLEQMWFLIDFVWDSLGCKNKKINEEKLSEFYNHPIWLLNGIFSEQHYESSKNREIVSDFISSKFEESQIIDYGGGTGVLSKLIFNKNKILKVDIYEPYPNVFAKKIERENEKISIVSQLYKNNYDCLVAMDVLEHVEKPLHVFYKMINCVKNGGTLIIANCFYPVIKCHLPRNFYLRYSFNIFAKAMGLSRVDDVISGYAKQYIKVKDKNVNSRKIKVLELFFRFVFLNIRILKPFYNLFKKVRNKI